jgi:hypothetical protein
MKVSGGETPDMQLAEVATAKVVRAMRMEDSLRATLKGGNE